MQHLFGMSRDGKTLAEYCENRGAALENAVCHWNPDELLGTPDQEITDYLIATYSVSCPVLRHDEGTSTEAEPVDLPAYSPIPGIAFGGHDRLPYAIPGTKRVFIIPYDGDMEVFYRRPNPFRTSELPEVEVRTRQVLITWQQADRDTPDPGQINAYVTKQVSSLQLYLDQSARQLEMFNHDLASRAAQLVAVRKQRLELDRDVSAKLLYPLKRRPDAAQYQFPLTRRPLVPRSRPSAAPGQPEYELADAAFEDVLKVLRHSRNALERSPSLTALLHEEQIRFILLVSLNAVFEGLAGGEVFNHKGKTDILIRLEDSNVFVGECKIWTGPSDFTEAISQLLNDLTWRDTKGTLCCSSATSTSQRSSTRPSTPSRNTPTTSLPDGRTTRVTATTSSCTPTATRTRSCTWPSSRSRSAPPRPRSSKREIRQDIRVLLVQRSQRGQAAGLR